MIIEKTSDFKPVPAGLHLARCYRIIDLGTQRSEFDGIVKMQKKIKIVWEVHGKDEDGTPTVTEKNEPMIVSKDYTFSWDDKANLKIDLQSWRGKPFTTEEQERFVMKSILDKWCMINIVHKNRKTGGGVYANISTVLPVLPIYKEQGMPKGHNACGMFQISAPDMDMFESFGKGIKAKIEQSPEWQSRNKTASSAPKGGSGFDDMDDDIPF
jgi:hypothetical protein